MVYTWKPLLTVVGKAYFNLLLPMLLALFGAQINMNTCFVFLYLSLGPQPLCHKQYKKNRKINMELVANLVLAHIFYRYISVGANVEIVFH
jgi:hypothetical protein